MRSLRWNSLSLSSQWSEKAQEKREVSVLKTTEREKREILEQFLALFDFSAFASFFASSLFLCLLSLFSLT